MKDRRIILIEPVLPLEENALVYRLATEFKKREIKTDFFAAVFPPEEKIVQVYKRAVVFSDLLKNLERGLSNNKYEAAVFSSMDVAAVYFEKVKSLSPAKTVFVNQNNMGSTDCGIKFDFISDEAGEILKFLDRDFSAWPEQTLTSIVILTFNQLKLTKQCVESVKKYTKVPYELIFVDNDSGDGTKEWLKELSAEGVAKIILNDENLGFSKANNQGIKQAKGDFILLLNNDVIVTEGWLERLLACARSETGIGLVGPCTNAASGPQKVGQGYKKISDLQKFATGFAIRNAGRKIECHRLNAFCLLINREVIDKMGFLDEVFGPGGFEDYDYCLRVRQAGYKIMLAKDAYIHHIGGQGYGPNKLDYSKLRQINKEIFIDKWCRKILEIMERLPDA